ncbi:MAG: hypothetical protein ACFFHV_14945 [Promethearchaeota archaeon]
MSIEKWLSKDSKEKREKIEKLYKELPKEKVLELKKKKIQDLKKKNREEEVDKIETDSIISDIIEFKNWMNQRTYLKGDLDKIAVKIQNLNRKLTLRNKELQLNDTKVHLIKQFRKIPPKFLDERTRIAINKKLNGAKRTNSDNYYLRKLKSTIGEKLNEANYYELLKVILEL